MVLKPPLARISVLAASGKTLVGNLSLIRAPTLTVSCRVTFDDDATSGVRVNLYFSADGNNYDTIPYAYFDVNLTAGGTIQETKIIDLPEKGYLNIEVENLDAVYTATDIAIWTTIKRESNQQKD